MERLGTSVSDLRLAARSLVEEAAVLGRPIRIEPSGPGPSFPIRVIGTAPRRFTPEPAYLHAMSAGSVTIAETFNNSHFPRAPSYAPAPGGSDVPRGVIQTLDFTRTVVYQALRDRADIDATAAPLFDIFNGLVHDNIPMRMRVCVGQEAAGHQHRVRIRLYGVDPSLDAEQAAERYSIWVSEPGLRCALWGRDEGPDGTMPPCDPTQYRVTTAPIILNGAGVERSGVSTTAVEWDITTEGGGFPGAYAMTGIPLGTNLYLTTNAPESESFLPEEDSEEAGTERWVRTQHRALAGFRADEGPAGGTFSRCTFFPIGGLVDDVLSRTMRADEDDPDQPAEHCAGVPTNIELPLEDEITESGTSSQVAEQVFLHYLDRASDAAARAENLGERLISEQVELQNLAENAVQRLNQICGTNVSAGHVPPMNVLPPCDSNADCDPGSTCRDLASAAPPAGRCMLGSLVDYLSGTDADMTRLRRCLGDDGGLTTATLGREPLCGWFTPDGELCGCPTGAEDECTEAACLSPGSDCSARFDGLPAQL